MSHQSIKVIKLGAHHDQTRLEELPQILYTGRGLVSHELADNQLTSNKGSLRKLSLIIVCIKVILKANLVYLKMFCSISADISNR